MNSLEGYNTNGHEYRISEIDRSNSRRLKWMMSEAKKEVDKKDKEKKQNGINSYNNNSNIVNNNSNKNMFKPSQVNRINNFNNNIK